MRFTAKAVQVRKFGGTQLIWGHYIENNEKHKKTPHTFQID